MRRTILWTAVAALAALAVLSIIGASQPGDHPEVLAAELFNSPPLVIFWFLLAGLLLAGLVSFRRLLRSPGPLAAHLGALLILIGAMAGSTRWNAVSHRYFGSEKIRSGAMVIPVGAAADEVLDPSDWHTKGALPFQLKLERFWIEYYPPKPWGLYVGVERADPGKKPVQREASVEWAVGKESPLPLTGGTIKVLQYYPHAEPIHDANFQPVLEIVRPDGNELLLPAKVGSEATLAEANVTLRVVRVLSHLAVVGNHEVVDDPNAPGPPAVELRIDRPGDANVRAFVWEEGVVGHDPNAPALRMRYVPHQLLAARRASEGPPAMQVLLTLDDGATAFWFAPGPRKRLLAVRLPLPPGPLNEHTRAYLAFAAPDPDIKAFKSEIAVLKDGRREANRTIEVNSPLHYGGYHFYQQDWDHEGERYTVLGVHSDTGLYTVYAGFVLMTLGVFLSLWVRKSEQGALDPEQAVYRVVRLGFPVLTLGLLLGAWWGKLAWGDYWGWDPKELWGLASWLVILGYLHWRCLLGCRFPRVNLGLAIAGLLAVVATLLAVNLGKHAYSGSRNVLEIKDTALGYLIMGAMLAYLFAGVALAGKNRKIGTGSFAAGFLLALAAVIVRWIDVDHLPLKELFEVFLFLGMLALPISLACRAWLHVGGEALDAFLGAIMLFPAAFVFSADAAPLMPALRTWLFAPHVAAYMVAYVVLAKAGLLALWHIVRKPAPLPARWR